MSALGASLSALQEERDQLRAQLVQVRHALHVASDALKHYGKPGDLDMLEDRDLIDAALALSPDGQKQEPE